jgi:hypothetical protein
MGTKQTTDIEDISRTIFSLRGQRVMLSGDLAVLYGVEHRALIQAVKRNRRRFPPDFMFQLNREEQRSLRSQFVISKKGRGGTRYTPSAFTEHGVAMLSSVLRSAKAIEVNIKIVRTFAQLRRFVLGNKELTQRFAELEKKYDGQFKAVFVALHELMSDPQQSPRKRIGFKSAIEI